VLLHSCQTLTPETDGTTHYFFQQSHRADAGDASVTEGIYQSLIAAFNEDRDMITAQYAAIRRDPGAAMLPLAIDAALVRYRRLLEEAIAAER
jgi:vanillate O-demethylase monooxygenase subunit